MLGEFTHGSAAQGTGHLSPFLSCCLAAVLLLLPLPALDPDVLIQRHSHQRDTGLPQVLLL